MLRLTSIFSHVWQWWMLLLLSLSVAHWPVVSLLWVGSLWGQYWPPPSASLPSVATLKGTRGRQKKRGKQCVFNNYCCKPKR